MNKKVKEEKSKIEKAKDKLVEGKEAVKHTVEKGTDYAKEHPAKALLTALGLGAVAGFVAGLLTKKKRE